MVMKFTGGQREAVYSAMMNNIAYANLNGVLTGCEVSASSPAAMTVDVTSGTIFFGNDEIEVSASTDTLTISSEATANTRVDLILVDSSGDLSVLEGTASAIPATPNYDPDDYIVLALIEVTSSTSTITSNEIKDLRVLNQGGAGGSGGTFGRHLEEFTSQTSVTVTHNLGDDEPNVFVYDDSDELIIPESVTVVDTNSLTVTFSTSTSGKIIVYGGTGLSNAYYTEEYTASTTWNVAHKLDNKYVNVTCYDSSDSEIEPSDITLTDEDNLVITWGVATAGRVVVTGGTSSITMDKMTDVDITSIEDGDLLQYNSTTEKWENTNAFDKTNSLINKSLTSCGLNLIRTGIDRDILFSKGGFDWFGDAYVDADGRENSVDTSTNTDATFDIDKYKTTSSATSYIYHNIPIGTFSSTISSCIGVPMIEDWETGADIQYKVVKIISELISYDDVSIDSQLNAPLDMFFSSDGSNLFICATIDERIKRFTLSTPWDLSTASYDSQLETSGRPLGMFFKSDGTKLYYISETPDNVYQYSLSTAWDLSTASNDGVTFTADSQDSSPRGLGFKSDGTKMYIGGAVTKKVYQYSLSTAWNVSSASYDSVNLDVSAQVSALIDITISPDGTNIYCSDVTGQKVLQYTLSTAWDLSTASFEETFDLSEEDISPRSSFFNDDSSKMYVVEAVTDKVHQYTVYSEYTLEDSGWLDYNEISEFTAFTSQPNRFIVKLIPKTTSPTAGYPSIRGFMIKEL